MDLQKISSGISIGKEGGFTLTEIVLVLLLLGIMAGVAIPSIRGIMDDATLDEATQEVVNTLRYARNLAIQGNTTRLVDLDPAQETCTLLLGYQSSGNNTLTFDNTQNPPGSETWGVRNVKVTNGPTVIFTDNNPYGKITGGDTTHTDKMDYSFNGSGQNLKLAYSVWDADTANEIAIYFNGVKIADAGKGLNGTDISNGWTKTKTISLPNVITGDTSIRNPLDKRSYVIDFKTSPRFTGVGIVSASFGSVDDVIFNPDGTPSQGGVIVLSYKSRSKTISVEDNTGKISVQ